MDINSLVAELKVEREKIDKAISALEAINTVNSVPVKTKDNVITMKSESAHANKQKAYWDAMSPLQRKREMERRMKKRQQTIKHRKAA